jgi:hypothetical protein
MKMRPVLFAIAACFYLIASAPGIAAEFKPVDGKAPVFRIFAAPIEGGKATINLSGKQPLLVVSAVADVALSRDRKAVRIILTPSDAHRFADITRKHGKELLVLEANGTVLEAMRVEKPVTNGMLQFDYPNDAKVADYLRKRFRLK